MTEPLWLPARYTPSLSEDFRSDADWLIPLVGLVWRLPDGSPLVLDPWQSWLLRRILEVYPEGHEKEGQLRYRRAFVSVARQNGKSVLGAILGLYGLVRETGALVIGIASSVDQARIVYQRVLEIIRHNPDLARRFRRATDTRGITATDGGRYEIKAAKSAALQGLDVSLGLVDELHLLPDSLWSDLVTGSRAKRNGLVVGITTAGDDSSELLLRLYQEAERAAPDGRFGYWIWEAPEPAIPADDETLGQYLLAANPGLACGRLDLAEDIESVRSLPPADAIRYRLNRFVSSSNPFMSLSVWAACRGALPLPDKPVISIDRTPDWTAASVFATWRAGDRMAITQIASMINPTQEKLEALCVDLKRHRPVAFVMDNYALGGLARSLRERGYDVRTASQSDVVAASALAYEMVAKGRVVHDGTDVLLAHQLASATRKNVGDSFRVVRVSGKQIDAVMAMVLGLYFTDQLGQPASPQLFL